jgi:alanine racemase
MTHPSWIEINLKGFQHNIAVIKEKLQQTKFCLPVKANGYGHGIYPISKAAIEAGVDYLGVSCLAEGKVLREHGITSPILIFGAIHEDQIKELIDLELELTISSLFKAQLVEKYCKNFSKQCNVHIEIDSGMQRTGVRANTFPNLFNFIKNNKCFNLKGIYSHFATADKKNDTFTLKQIEIFKKIITDVAYKNILFHLANSGGVCYFPSSYFDMVRPGLLTYGYFPNEKTSIDVNPCFVLKSKISYFKVVSQGVGISYGHKYITKKNTRIVTIPIGYGDGYRRDLSNKGSVLIREQKFPIVGTICMDQLMVDIGNSTAFVGDEVVLIGKQGEQEITLKEIADLCSTIPYEILCGFTERIPRIYQT